MGALTKEKDVRVLMPTRVEGEKFVTEAEGEFARDGDVFCLAYTECSNGEVTRNGLQISREKMLLHRDGAVCGEMLFDPGTVTRASYRTMGMEMSFAVRTVRYDVFFDEKLMVIDLRYSLQENENAVPTRYALKIEISDAPCK